MFFEIVSLVYRQTVQVPSQAIQAHFSGSLPYPCAAAQHTSLAGYRCCPVGDADEYFSAGIGPPLTIQRYQDNQCVSARAAGPQANCQCDCKFATHDRARILPVKSCRLGKLGQISGYDATFDQIFRTCRRQ